MNICKFMLSGVLLSDLSKSVRYIALHWPVAMGARTEISVKFNRIYFLSNRPLSLKIILQFHCRFWSVEINIWVKNLKILFAGAPFQTWKKFLSNSSLRPRTRSWLYFCSFAHCPGNPNTHLNCFQTPCLGLGPGVDFTFVWDNNNNIINDDNKRDRAKG